MPPKRTSSESKEAVSSDEVLQAAASRYKAVLEERASASSAKGAAELPALDRYLWEDVGASMRKRGHATLDELKDVMKWKLLRGKFRPTLPALVASNSPDSVEDTTKAAFSTYLKCGAAIVDASTARECLRELCKLRGVGPATASLLMAILNPVGEPFMSDESWECLADLSGRKIAYKESDWVAWRQAFMRRLDDAGAADGVAAIKWGKEGARGLDKACWAYKHGGGEVDPSHGNKEDAVQQTRRESAQKAEQGQKEESPKKARAPKRKAAASDCTDDPSPKERKTRALRKSA